MGLMRLILCGLSNNMNQQISSCLVCTIICGVNIQDGHMSAREVEDKFARTTTLHCDDLTLACEVDHFKSWQLFDIFLSSLYREGQTGSSLSDMGLCCRIV